MREIKFRGKRVDNDEWVMGDLITDLYKEKTYIHNRISGVPNFNGDFMASPIVMCEVIPETVGQFTGSVDSKGVDIYDGDALNITSDGVQGFVVWDNDELEWDISVSDINLKIGCFYSEYFEVIGNIHEGYGQ